jgi:Fe(3+) dicitrate transport protein
VLKGGLTFRREGYFNITFSGVYVSEQFWQDSNIGSVSIPPARIPSYAVFNLSGEYYITKNIRVFGNLSNLADKKYYSRVFPFGGGSIEPAPRFNGYAGVSFRF